MNCLVIDAPKISHEQIVTNDLVELINDHQFILLGRIDNVVNSGGIKLIRSKLKKNYHMEFIRFFFVELQMLYLAKISFGNEGEKQLLDEHIYSSLDKYQKPKVFFILINSLRQKTEK
jgi:O-succinylbenzoic acid--CoA ligase